MGIVVNFMVRRHHCDINGACIGIQSNNAHRCRANRWITIAQNLCLRRRPPEIIFARIDRPYNFIADSFRTYKLCSRLSSCEVQFYTEKGHVAFLGPRLRATYDDHLRLIGKCIVDFLLVLIELFC